GSSTDRENYTVVTIGPDVVLRGWSGIFISKDEDGGDNNYGIVINFKGTAINPGMDAHSAAGYGLYINGSNNKTTGNVPIININGGKIQSLGAGIYAAGFAKWNIFGNTKITGKESAIEIRAGKLNITDGIFTATNKPTSITANGNGTTSDGVAIAVAQHTTKLPIDVNISGGSFNGYSALYESNPQNNDSESIAKVKLEVSSGTFNATNGGTVAVYSKDCTSFITGGTFSSDPSTYVNTNYKAKANENDTWTVIKK
ncbi:MAG: hypothetical protein PUC01_01780, partial [Spirochaetales bacterium]|nr:hypothetical protein [Spirochaetales bacterium]